MRKRISKALKADGDKASARRQNKIQYLFHSTHPKAWVNKICTDEGAIVLKEV